MRKLRRLPETTVVRIEHPHRRGLDRRNYRGRDSSIFPRERLRLRNRALHHLGLLDYVPVLLRVSIGNAQQHPPKTRTSIAVGRWKICSSIKRLPVGRKKRGQRPPSLSAPPAPLPDSGC